MAGIETNPGPSRRIWFCSVCGNVIRNNTTSVQCNGCKEWCHLKDCSGLQHHRRYDSSFIARCCGPATTSQPIQRATRIPHQQTSSLAFKILQLNCNGLRSKLDEIANFMAKHEIQVAALQETKLNRTVNVQLDGYTIVRCDRERDRGGGLAFIIDNKVKFRTVSLPTTTPADIHLEQLSIAILSDKSAITLVNVYIPPQSSCPPAYAVNIQHLLSLKDCIIMGDFNAHHSSWHSALDDDARGTVLAEQIDQSDFGSLNEDKPTRVASDTISSPDITLASPSLLPCTEWTTHTALSSDHLPIIVELQKTITKIKADCRTYTNFSKANWSGFRDYTERKFARVHSPRNVFRGEKIFRGIVKKAARIYIPAGRFKEIRPNFPTDAARLADERDRLRETDPNNPRIQQLSNDIRKIVNDHKRDKWREHLDKCKLQPGTGSLWKTIKRLSNPQKTANNIAIASNGVHVQDDKKCANQFNRLFTPHPSAVDKSVRNTMRTIHKLPTDEFIFEENEVEGAIKSTKPSRALGPDDISPIMLKQLGPFGISFITVLLNLSMSSLLIPALWKIGRIIPLLKPNKPEDQASSYRPISLLSPVAKLFETLLLPLMTEHLPLASHQHGFRKAHSTTTALHCITDQIQRGLNQRRPNLRTIVVALDLSRAFDTVDHGLLLREVLETTVPSKIKRWLANYLRGRQTFVEFRNTASKYRKLKQGVPQGGVLSPLLFNYYMASLPQPPEGVEVVSYADDISVLCTNSNIEEACNKINGYLDTLRVWLATKNLELSPGKSTSTIFTTWNREMHMHLDIKVGDTSIPTVGKPRILGVIFDNLLTFSAHTKQVCEKLISRNNVLKSLAGSTWGKDKETILTTFKAIGRSILNYAAPIWSPQTSDTAWKKLQVSQNVALRTATGCHLMSSQNHLHSESKMLPVREHNNLLSQQYLLKCHLQDHPCTSITRVSPPPRNIRKSLSARYQSDIAHHVPESGLDQVNYKRSLKELHTEAVTNTIDNLINPVLDAIPPAINNDEKLLPRTTRTTLAQLRSGWCRLLNHYMSRIDPDVIDVCPSCGVGPHDARHLFECPSNPTHLSVESLWTKPREAAAFLNLKANEDDE